MAWFSGYNYRKLITLSRASGAVSNYQMKLLVGESSGATGEDVDLNSRGQTDFDDLRFTKSDGTTLLDYWIESISGTTPNQLATVWIKFDSIGTGATTFYMYYGNAGATAGSNGDNTFIFFDGFPGSAIDTNKWEGDTGYASVASGIMSFVGDGWKWMRSKITSGQVSIAVRGKVKLFNSADAATGEAFGLENAAQSHRSFPYLEANSVDYLLSADGTTQTVSATNLTIGSFRIFDIKVLGGVSMAVFDEGTEKQGSPKTTNPSNSTALKVVFGNTLAASSIQADWVLMRNYISTEPAWGSWGSEETAPTTGNFFLLF